MPTSLGFARGTFALAVISLSACSADTVVATDPRGESRARSGGPAASATTPAISDHIAFWFLSGSAGISNFLAPVQGPAVNAQRLAAGYYSMTVNGMSDYFHPGNKEIVMTTTYGTTTTAQCSVPAWGSSASVDQMWVTTFCDDMITGQQLDAPFSTLIVGNNSLSGTSAFAFADRPWSASYVPDTSRSFTTGTASNMLIQRIGVGDYYVNLGTGSPQGTTYMVKSAYELAMCAIGEWKNFGVRVRCFDQSEASVDAQFNILQVGGGRYSPDTYGAVRPYAFAWVDQRSATTMYMPNTSYSRAWTGDRFVDSISVRRTAVGDYRVEIPGLQNPLNDPETVHVTPFGLTYAACTIVNFADTPGGTTMRVLVQCRDSHGAPIDTRFNLLILR